MTAIIFIILFILETTFVIYAFLIGSKVINLENNCRINCYSKDADAYNYLSDGQLCECYKNNEVFYSEVLK